MTDDTTLIGFNAICQFVKELSTQFGKQHKPLRLYNRLISQTKISHTEAIKKHITIFHDFCIANKEALLNKDPDKLVQKKVEYSERVYIDISFMFHLAKSDKDDVETIWKHLLTIYAIIEPTDNAKEVLKKSSSEEKEFINDIVAKLEKNIKPDTNPTEAMASILQSGVINDVIGGMQKGQIDIGRLLGVAQGLIGNLGDDPESKQAANMMTNVLSGLSNGNGIDMGGLMSVMTAMMGGMMVDSGPKQLEEKTEKK